MSRARPVGLLLLLAVVAAGVGLGWPLPEAWFAEVGSRRVLDRHGGVLWEVQVPDRGRESWTPLEAIPDHVVDALLAAEDHRFLRHPGLDPVAILRAARANLAAGRVVQGGSTLSQQTARLLVARPPGLLGKAVEAWRAVRLDLHLDKPEILAWYLNRAYFGHQAWGIAAAARTYFDEGPAGLSVAEAATLVALLPAPSRLDPWKDRGAALAARDRVIGRMLATGRLDPDAAAHALAEPMQLRRPRSERLAPHLSARVLDEDPASTVVPTTLDPDLQRDVEALVREQLDALEGRDVDHAAVLVADVATGEVLAWVGSGDFDAEDGQVDGVRALRSPGSALKPFAYALAFEGGLQPTDALPDVPRTYTTSHGAWTPRNYSERFRGPVLAREALATSANLPAVAVVEEVGVSTLLARLRMLGFDGLRERPAHYGLGLVLGDGEVRLQELVAAYASLARGGTWRPLRYRQDAPPGEERAVIDPQAAWLVTDILDDPVARAPAFGRWGALERPFPAAVKTGTSTGFRDNWAVGYTPRHVVGVWVGNFDGRPMGEVSGVTGAGPLWAAVTDRVTGGARVPFVRPDGIVRGSACALSGLAPGPHCPHTLEADRLDLPERPACDWHVPLACADAVARVTVRWPAAYATWAEAGHDLPAGCVLPVAEAPDEVAIAWPTTGATFWIDPTLPRARQRIPLRAAARTGAREAVWRVDGRTVAAVGPPFTTLWAPDREGSHRIELEIDGVPAPSVEVHVARPGLDRPAHGG